MNRRGFLSSLIAAGGVEAVAAEVRALAGSVLPSKLKTIGIQLYSVRRELERDFEGTLARLASIGYNEVEFAGYFGRQPREIRALLERHRLAAPSAHVSIEVVRQNWTATLEGAAKVGHRFVVVPWLPPESRATLDDFKRLAAEFNRLGEAAKRASLRFAYHNHDFEFDRRDGQIPFDVLLAETDPSLVAFELDLFWITKGGQDPVEYFARYPGRFKMVHVKDSSGPPRNEQVTVGEGTIDFGRILGRRAQAGIEHVFAEHDEPSDAFGFARASYQYLKQLKLEEG